MPFGNRETRICADGGECAMEAALGLDAEDLQPLVDAAREFARAEAAVEAGRPVAAAVYLQRRFALEAAALELEEA